MIVFTLFLVFWYFPDKVDSTISCYFCQGQPASFCLQKKVTCPPDHMCFMESITSSRNETLFVAGCRTRKLCSWMVSPVGRRSIVDQCAQCCDATSSPLCNGRLCKFNDKGKCRVCSGLHHDAQICPISQCADNEMCFTGTRYIGGTMLRVYGCESTRMCEALARAIAATHPSRRIVDGDHGLHTCDACCNGNDCNARDCEDLAKGGLLFLF
ncbi:uncharacterized protein LOC134281933 isoform X2 [Saccostrea cucullata]|uniref:uncharacterized protein LOC134281933 isoform X2 n=1 Tax=Saccostrea cuccullata TaxID=36930 RepID=UPI002ED405D5